MESKGHIESFSPEGLCSLCEEFSLPSFRAKQLLQWLYGKAARSYDEMTNLPQALRALLEENYPLSGRFPSVVDRQVSVDGTRKYLIRFADGVTVETVGLPTEDRLTVCFSTQAGCGMGCVFCATGKSGLVRSLLPGEMAWQVILVSEDFGERVTNAVAMGQGEPFANYDAALGALRILNHASALGIGARHITVSTCGILPGIERFSAEPEQFTLAVSLHSAIQKKRDALMPGVRGYSLAELRKCCESYVGLTGRRVSFEYALIEGVNDGDEDLEALLSFCRGLLCHVNLIPNNEVDPSLRASSHARVLAFQRGLQERGTETTIRVARGTDIDGACGQLRQRYN